MREPKNVRHLATHEIEIAKSVFKNTIPYDDVVISDGLGGGDRPFTVPTSMPIRVPFYTNFNVRDGKFVIHAGDGYYGMSRNQEDKKLLIHELTHVWQGTNDTSWSWAYAIFSLKDQALSDDAYAYDKMRLEPWEGYGPEQQAQIVEDWFADGMQSFDPVNQTGDRRFYYIKKYIRGEEVVGDWTIIPIRPLEAGTLHVKMSYPDYAGPLLLPILERRLRANDSARIAARRKELVDIFQKFGPDSAQQLLMRLSTPKSGDKLARAFHDRLATAERQQLTHILMAKTAGK
jgi:hypothetical protein